MHAFDLKLLNRFNALAKPYWHSDEKWRAHALIFLLLLLLISETWLNVQFNTQSAEFTSALAGLDAPRFWMSIRTFVLLLIVAVPVYSYYYYVRDKLTINWRLWLTRRLLSQYLERRSFYHLLQNSEIDNPDQRIAEDISSFTQQSIILALVFANALFQLFAFSRVLWSISQMLVLIVTLYAAVGTAITFGVFGKEMASLYFDKRKREANFRFGLVRIREHAESIALYRGEKQEQSELEKIFREVVSNFNRLIDWTLRLNFFHYFYRLLTALLPALVIAPRVLSGELEVGSIVQVEGACAAILGALTVFADNLESLSSFAACVDRLDSFSQCITPAQAPAAPERSRILARDTGQLSFANVTLMTPNYARTVVKNLTISVPPGNGLMIIGASGCGKSSLLRLISGLWDSGTGTIERPRPEEMLFLPQHAYMIAGSLRRQLCYPHLDRTVSAEEIHEVLRRVNLSGLVQRCGGLDAEFDFEMEISTGERQRLAFARAFLNRPRYLLLDEATSALDQENEASIYSQLAATSCTLISVSHHPALEKYHSQVLELAPGGAWRLRPAVKSDAPESGASLA